MKGTFHTEAQGDKTRFYFTSENGSKGVVLIESMVLAFAVVEDNREWETNDEFLIDLFPGLVDTSVDLA